MGNTLFKYQNALVYTRYGSLTFVLEGRHLKSITLGQTVFRWFLPDFMTYGLRLGNSMGKASLKYQNE